MAVLKVAAVSQKKKEKGKELQRLLLKQIWTRRGCEATGPWNNLRAQGGAREGGERGIKEDKMRQGACTETFLPAQDVGVQVAG